MSFHISNNFDYIISCHVLSKNIRAAWRGVDAEEKEEVKEGKEDEEAPDARHMLGFCDLWLLVLLFSPYRDGSKPINYHIPGGTHIH